MLKDTIYTIPISDVFEPRCGCPICLMRDMLENRNVEYVMGAAMMEPDIRVQTNKYGFCTEHFSMIVVQKNRLSLALMLETHLDELNKKHFPLNVKKGEATPANTCYVCNEISASMDKMLETILTLYFADSSFKKLVNEQEFFCYQHYELLVKKASVKLNKKQSAIFIKDITEITRKYLLSLRDDVHSFSKMFDYRNANIAEKSDDVKFSLERAISFLTGR